MNKVLPLAVALLALVASSLAQDQSDFFDNDLAKVCKPIDRALDLLFILDGSGSVSGNTFDTQMRQVYKILDMVDIAPEKTQMAVMQYSGYTRMEFNFNDYQNKTSLIAGLKGIRHISGTTKTGKALKRALDAFQHDSGARADKEAVAQVAVVVSDGHSHDDPVPAANLLRQNGVKVMALGIGNHINMDELIQITGDPVLAFRNDSLDNFIHEFRKLAVGEHCDYAKGPNGAEILCQENAIEVNVLTIKPFKGHLYVSGQFEDSNCVAKAGNNVSANDKDLSVSLRIPLMGCGIQKQFLFSPRGLLFETGVILKFHPEYNTKHDKAFVVRCFYPDSKFDAAVQSIESGSSNSVVNGVRTSVARIPIGFSNGLIRDRLVVSSSSVPNLRMPCAYKVTRKTDGCVLEDTKVGDSLVHEWECDNTVFGGEFGMLVHSCSIMSLKTKKEILLIDENGCSLDQSVIGHPEYPEPLVATVSGMAVKYADSSLMKYRCSLRFCNILKGECGKMLPPRCPGSNTPVNRPKRQLSDHSANMDGMPSQLVERLFMRHKYNRLPSGLHRASVFGQRRSRDESIIDPTLSASRFGRPPPLVTFGPPSIRGSGSVSAVDTRRPSGVRVHPPFRAGLGINIGSSQKVVASVNPLTTIEPVTADSSTEPQVIRAHQPNFPWSSEQFPPIAPLPSTKDALPSDTTASTTTDSSTVAVNAASSSRAPLRSVDIPVGISRSRNREEIINQASAYFSSQPIEAARAGPPGIGQPGHQNVRAFAPLPARPLLINPSAPLGPDGRPAIFQLPEGGMDVKLNTQDVIIVNKNAKKNLTEPQVKSSSIVDDSLEASGEDEGVEDNLAVLSQAQSAKKEDEVALVTDKVVGLSTETTTLKAPTSSVPTVDSVTFQSASSVDEKEDEEISETHPEQSSTSPASTTSTAAASTQSSSAAPVSASKEAAEAATGAPVSSAAPQSTLLIESPVDYVDDAVDYDVTGNSEIVDSSSSTAPLAPIISSEESQMRLQGLAKEILAQINFMQLDLESQILNVHDLEDFRNQGQSPVDWCPRSDVITI